MIHEGHEDHKEKAMIHEGHEDHKEKAMIHEGHEDHKEKAMIHEGHEDHEEKAMIHEGHEEHEDKIGTADAKPLEGEGGICPCSSFSDSVSLVFFVDDRPCFIECISSTPTCRRSRN
jgi:hypothetical protein